MHAHRIFTSSPSTRWLPLRSVGCNGPNSFDVLFKRVLQSASPRFLFLSLYSLNVSLCLSNQVAPLFVLICPRFYSAPSFKATGWLLYLTSRGCCCSAVELHGHAVLNVREMDCGCSKKTNEAVVKINRFRAAAIQLCSV